MFYQIQAILWAVVTVIFGILGAFGQTTNCATVCFPAAVTMLICLIEENKKG